MAGRVSRAANDQTPDVAKATPEGASLLSRMADEADLCLAVLGRNDSIVYANAGFAKLLGFARTEGGEPMWLSGLFRRVFDAAGEVQATAVLLQDITEGRVQALQRDALEA